MVRFLTNVTPIRLPGYLPVYLPVVPLLVAAGALQVCACGSSTPANSPNGASNAMDAAAPVADAAGTADATSATTSDAAAEGGPAQPWDWNGIVGTGQSLSVGAMSTPVTFTQPYNNLKLALGAAVVPPFDPTSTALSMVPLVEPIRPVAQTYPSAYPKNIYGETPHTAMADQITALFRQATPAGDYVSVHTVVGESGQAISVIDKTAVATSGAGMSTGYAYAATLFEASSIARLAAAAHKTYGIGAIVLTHGESDAGNSAYQAAMVELWSDYNADLSAITGQTTSIPMLVSQQESVPAGMGQTSPSTLAEWYVGVAHPGDIICTGPKYQYPYFTDNIHLTAVGYDELGEKYAEVYYAKVVLGQNWQPLQPIAASRAGAVLTVQFHVPALPLVWDDTFPASHSTGYPQWASGRGFEVLAGGLPVTISSVAIVNDTVQITCGQDLTGLQLTVGYAYTADGAPMPGGTARWGNLRDSDPLVGLTSHLPQPNYAVSFAMPVP